MRRRELWWVLGAAGLAAGCTTEALETTQAPSAFAGWDGEVVVGAAVPLDGSLSRDPDGDALTYRWVLEARPDGSRASVVAPRAIVSTFTADEPGTYVASLTVSDGERTSRDLVAFVAREVVTATTTLTLGVAPGTCNVELSDPGESACAGADGRVTLTPTLPTLPPADRALHQVEWSFLRVPAGALPEELGTSTTTLGLDAAFSFTPPRPGEYWVSARLVGPRAAAGPALASVAVFDDGAPSASRPVVHLAAPAQARRVSRVLLDGRASEVAAGGVNTWRWSLVVDPSGGVDTLAEFATGCPTGACRILIPSVAGVYLVGLAISHDGVEGATALVALEVK